MSHRRKTGRRFTELLREGIRLLRQSGSESPGLDAEILLREASGLSREQLFESLPAAANDDVADAFNRLIQQRLQGIPIAYITGRRAFYGHDFMVTRQVLVPRPETEYLVKYAVNWLATLGEQPATIVDVGTGSGAIAISIALECAAHHRVIGSDVSPEALEVARDNARHLGATVEWVEGSLLDWLSESVDIVAANLPYLRPDQAHPGITHEPPIALFTGEDGFDLNRELIEQANIRLKRPGALIMELDPVQAPLALSTARRYFSDATVEIRADLAGEDRYLVVEADR